MLLLLALYKKRVYLTSYLHVWPPIVGRYALLCRVGHGWLCLFSAVCLLCGHHTRIAHGCLCDAAQFFPQLTSMAASLSRVGVPRSSLPQNNRAKGFSQRVVVRASPERPERPDAWQAAARAGGAAFLASLVSDPALKFTEHTQ